MNSTAIYVIIFGLLCIFIALSPPSQMDGFQNAEKRFALIIRGEAFRKGGQGNRDDGKSDTYDEQKAACKTHMDLVNKIVATGFLVDVYIDTYSTEYDNDIRSWYGPNLKDARFHKTKFNSQRSLIKDGLEMINEKEAYDALMIVRIDLYLKPAFIEKYDPTTSTVQFPFILWTLNSKTAKGNPMVSDTIFHFPKAHYDKLYGLYSGNTWGDNTNHAFLDHVPLEYGKEYSLLTTHFHDSDSAKDFNPFYKMVGRPENPVWYDGNQKEFPRDF